MAKTKDVRAAVEKELGFDPRVDSAHITVSNISGDVTLTGSVPSYPQYLEAAAAARRVIGVTGVHNHLEVVLPDGSYRDDVIFTLALCRDQLKTRTGHDRSLDGDIPEIVVCHHHFRLVITVHAHFLTLSSDPDSSGLTA